MSAQESAGKSGVGLQFSVYPLRQEHLHPAIEAAVQGCRQGGRGRKRGPPQHLRPRRRGIGLRRGAGGVRRGEVVRTNRHGRDPVERSAERGDGRRDSGVSRILSDSTQASCDQPTRLQRHLLPPYASRRVPSRERLSVFAITAWRVASTSRSIAVASTPRPARTCAKGVWEVRGQVLHVASRHDHRQARVLANQVPWSRSMGTAFAASFPVNKLQLLPLRLGHGHDATWRATHCTEVTVTAALPSSACPCTTRPSSPL